MSENEYIDLNEFEEDTFFHQYFDSINNDDSERVKNVNRRSKKTSSARNRIEDYLEMKQLREKINDPVFYLEKSLNSADSRYYP